MTCIVTVASIKAEQSPTKTNELTEAEAWIVAQLNAGEIADLPAHFRDENDWKIDAHFLEDLLAGAVGSLKQHRHGIRIIGAIIDEPVELNNAQIKCEVQLTHCHLRSGTTFNGASFAGSISFDESVFDSGVSFANARITGDASFKNITFKGPVSFMAAEISGFFYADETEFWDEETGAMFAAMKIGGSASFERAIFNGPTSFLMADIVGHLLMSSAQFCGRTAQRAADFVEMKVRRTAFFEDAMFEGPVKFTLADVAGSFVATTAEFHDREEGVTFGDLKVGGDASFGNAVFEGPVNFTAANFAAMFDVGEAKFRDNKKGVMFGRMKVGGDAYFFDTVFEGPANLSYTDLGWVDLSTHFWPKNAAQFNIQGMKYKYARAVIGNEPESHDELLKLADQAAYTVDAYANLEVFFLSNGYRSDADRAFVAGKRRERREYLSGLQWAGSWLLDWLVGYGRRPWQAGIPCAFFVALGCFVFAEGKMERQDLKELEKPAIKRRVYNRFWYSLGLFLPFVNLQTAEFWKPKRKHTFLRNYVRVHILLGWILIPILLAAISGLIK
jgi:uncharacterized protein YjbI with pentapeptide repeats